jgi:acyl carrier protein
MKLRDEIFSKMVERAAPLFGIKPENMTEDMRFEEDFQAKSVHYSQITTYLEDIFDVEIPYMTFRRKATIGEAVDYVLKLVSE